jgi:hypothetical protein
MVLASLMWILQSSHPQLGLDVVVAVADGGGVDPNAFGDAVVALAGMPATALLHPTAVRVTANAIAALPSANHQTYCISLTKYINASQ